MGSVDIGIERGELVIEGVGDEALRGEMVALIGLGRLDNGVDAGVAFQGGSVERDLFKQVPDAAKTMLRVFNCDAADDTVNLVALGQEEFSEIGTVLAGNAGNKGSFAQHGDLRISYSIRFFD